MLYAMCKSLAVTIMKALFRLEAHGTEHVPRTGPLLVVPTHPRLLAPPLVGGMTPRQLTYLAKAELFDVPGFGALLRRLGAQPLRRQGADPSALRTAQRVLQGGGALLVFPEGTRGDEGVLGEAKPGAALLAIQTGAAVVPAYVHGSGRALPRGRWLPRPAKVRVTFGAPLTFPKATGRDRKAQYEEASRQMMAAIARLRDEVVRGAGVAQARRTLQIT